MNESANQRLRVFLSSSMEELRDERAAVKDALKSHYIDAWVFEHDAGARPDSIENTYRQEIESADIYIGIFGNKYGQYTLEEYQYARSLRKDCLIYQKRMDLIARDPRLQDLLNAIGKVKEGHTVRWFTTTEDLSESVKQDVARWQATKIHSVGLFANKKIYAMGMISFTAFMIILVLALGPAALTALLKGIPAGIAKYLPVLIEVISSPREFTLKEILFTRDQPDLTDALSFLLISWFLLLGSYSLISFKGRYILMWSTSGTAFLLLVILLETVSTSLVARWLGVDMKIDQLLAIQCYQTGGFQALLSLAMLFVVGSFKFLNPTLFEEFIKYHKREPNTWLDKARSSKAYHVVVVLLLLSIGALGYWSYLCSDGIRLYVRVYASIHLTRRSVYSDVANTFSLVWSVTSIVTGVFLLMIRKIMIKY